MSKQLHKFSPSEIIFSTTDDCNLHCPHCFVKRNSLKLDIEKATIFLDSCKNSTIEKIGFSGGEPFLYMDFLTQIITHSVKNDFMFDRLMTNGIWWENESELTEKLKLVYNAGFDGKIGLSWDVFHNQDLEKIFIFISSVHSIFGTDRLDIQSVIKAGDLFEIEIHKLSQKLNCEIYSKVDKKTGKGFYILQNPEIYLPVFREPQTFYWNSPCAWKAKKWFKEDFCQGPGNILFIHPNGKIAPCCGFANEEEKLFIGDISDSLGEVLKKASENPMVSLCYEKGLSTLRKNKEVKKLLKSKGFCKTAEECTFCQFIAKNYEL